MHRTRRYRLSDMPDITNIKLTPEQEELRKKMEEEEQIRMDQEEEEQILFEAEQHFKQVKYILDNIQAHPLIKEIIGLKRELSHEKYARIAFEVLLTTHPNITPEDLAAKAKKIGLAMADELLK